MPVTYEQILLLYILLLVLLLFFILFFNLFLFIIISISLLTKLKGLKKMNFIYYAC